MDQQIAKKAFNMEDFNFFLEYALAPIKKAVSELEKRMDEAQQNIMALAIHQGAVIEGMAGNIVVETFSGTDGYVIVSGAYDSDNSRIYA